MVKLNKQRWLELEFQLVLAPRARHPTVRQDSSSEVGWGSFIFTKRKFLDSWEKTKTNETLGKNTWKQNLFQLIDRQLVANCCQFQKPEKRLPQDQKYFSFSAHHCFLRKRYLKKKQNKKVVFTCPPPTHPSNYYWKGQFC